MSSEQDSVSVDCGENVPKNYLCIEKNGSATYIQDNNNNQTGVEVSGTVPKGISSNLEDKDFVKNQKKSNKDTTSQQKTKRQTKKEQERISYSRQKEAELLRQQLLAKVKEDEERERKKREKEAERRRKVEEQKKESLLQQAVLSLKDTKPKGNSKKVDRVSGPPKQNPRKANFTVHVEDIGSGDSALDLWGETDVPMKENISKSDGWDDDIWQEDTATKGEDSWQSLGISNDILNKDGMGNHVSSYYRSNSTRGSSRSSRNVGRSGNRNNNKSQKDSRRGNSVNQRRPERGRSRQNSHSRSTSESRPQSAWGSSTEQKQQLKDFVPAPQPEVNVWRERQIKSENIREIEPLNTTDEEVMLMKAIRESKMQFAEDEKKRKKWEELQLKYAISNSALDANHFSPKDVNGGNPPSDSAGWQPLCENYVIDHGLHVASESTSSHSQHKHSEVQCGGARPKTSSNQWSDVWDVSYNSKDFSYNSKDSFPPIQDGFGKSATNGSGWGSDLDSSRSPGAELHTKNHKVNCSSDVNKTSFDNTWGDNYSLEHYTGDKFQKSGFSSEESAAEDVQHTKDDEPCVGDPVSLENSAYGGWESKNPTVADKLSPHGFNALQDEIINEEPSVPNHSTSIVCSTDESKDSCWEIKGSIESSVKCPEHGISDEIQKDDYINAVASDPPDKSSPDKKSQVPQDDLPNSRLHGSVPCSIGSDMNCSDNYLDKDELTANKEELTANKEELTANIDTADRSPVPCDISQESLVQEAVFDSVQTRGSTFTQASSNSVSSESFTFKLSDTNNPVTEPDRITGERFSYQNSSQGSEDFIQNINSVLNEKGQLSLLEEARSHTLFGREPDVSTTSTASSKVVGSSIGQKVHNSDESSTRVTMSSTGTPSLPNANNMPTGCYPFAAPVDPSLWLSSSLPMNTSPFMWGPMMMPYSSTFFLQQLRALQMYYVSMGIPQQPLFMPPTPMPVPQLFPQNAMPSMPNPSNSIQSHPHFNPNAQVSQDVPMHQPTGSRPNVKTFPPGIHRNMSSTEDGATVNSHQTEVKFPSAVQQFESNSHEKSETVLGSPQMLKSYHANTHETEPVVPDTRHGSFSQSFEEMKNVLGEIQMTQTSDRGVNDTDSHELSFILPPMLPEKSFSPKVVNGDNREPNKQLEIPASQDVPSTTSESGTLSSSHLRYFGASRLTPDDDESYTSCAIPPPRLAHRNKHSVVESIRQPKCSVNHVFDLMCGKGQSVINPPVIRKPQSDTQNGAVTSVPNDVKSVSDTQLPKSVPGPAVEIEDPAILSSSGPALPKDSGMSALAPQSFHCEQSKNSDWSIPVKNTVECTTEGWDDLEESDKTLGSVPNTAHSGWSDNEDETVGTYTNYSAKGWDDLEESDKTFGSVSNTAHSGWSDNEDETVGTYTNYSANKESDIWGDAEITKHNKTSVPNKNFSSKTQFNRGPQKYYSQNAASENTSMNYSSQAYRDRASSRTSSSDSSRGISNERRNFSSMRNGHENAMNRGQLSGVQKIFHRSDRRNR